MTHRIAFYAASVLVVLALLAGVHWRGYVLGQQHVQAEWDRDRAAVAQATEAERHRMQDLINQQSQQLAQQTAKQRAKDKLIIQQANRYVPPTDNPADNPMLPGGFRLHHDSAAAGEPLGDTSGTDASPVSTATVATAVAENYSACRYDQERLAALQEIVRTINGNIPACQKE